MVEHILQFSNLDISTRFQEVVACVIVREFYAVFSRVIEETFVKHLYLILWKPWKWSRRMRDFVKYILQTPFWATDLWATAVFLNDHTTVLGIFKNIAVAQWRGIRVFHLKNYSFTWVYTMQVLYVRLE